MNDFTVKLDLPAPAVELILFALNKLPREQSDNLFRSIATVYEAQFKANQARIEEAQTPIDLGPVGLSD